MKRVLFSFILSFISLLINAQNDYIIETERNNKVVSKTKEEVFVEENFKTIPMCQWDKSTKFMFERNVLNKNEANWLSFISDLKCKGNVDLKFIADKIFYVNRIYEKKVSCPRGRCVRTYIEFKFENNIFTYEYLGSKEELCANSGNAGTKVDLVYLGDVDIARKILVGKTMYTTRKTNAKSLIAGRVGKQYDKVCITRVGTSLRKEAPVRIFFKDEHSIEYYVDVYLSNTNQYIDKYLINEYIYVPCVFSFEDIRLNYPNISDEIWEYIKNHEVKIGMNKTECILSIGNPSNKNSDISSSGIVNEQWVYNRLYVYFKDGEIDYIQNR